MWLGGEKTARKYSQSIEPWGGYVPVDRKHTTAHNGTTAPLRVVTVVVRWLIVIIYCPSRGSDSVRTPDTIRATRCCAVVPLCVS